MKLQDLCGYLSDINNLIINFGAIPKIASSSVTWDTFYFPAAYTTLTYCFTRSYNDRTGNGGIYYGVLGCSEKTYTSFKTIVGPCPGDYICIGF